jgi:hypothetical protein
MMKAAVAFGTFKNELKSVFGNRLTDSEQIRFVNYYFFLQTKYMISSTAETIFKVRSDFNKDKIC